MEEDWRLNGQEEYLRNAVLYRIVFPVFWEKAYADKNAFYEKVLDAARRYAEGSPDKKEYLEGEKIQRCWHEHCDFCWDKAMTDGECEFYCTKDMRHWVCSRCFHDFKEEFGWTVKTADELFD